MTYPWEQPPTGAFAERVARIGALVPVIETERFRLRAPRIEDFPIYARFHLDGGSLDDASLEDREACWLDFCQLIVSWLLRGFGPWTIEPRAGGPAIGAVAFNHEFGDPEVEIGWVVAGGTEGQGIATEAARAARDYLCREMGFRNLVSYIDPANRRSAAVAERLGAVRDAAAEEEVGRSLLAYRHPDPEERL